MRKFNRVTLVLFIFLLRAAIFAQSRTAFPRLEPDPKALEYYKLSERNQNYSWTELAEISLWASGDYSASNIDKIRAAAETLNNSPARPQAAKEKAEFILGFMHKNLLKSYSLNQTRIDTLLSNGRFNCVSSAVLYMILCESAGLHASGVMTKDHAFMTLHIGESDIDVETTNPYGFDPGNRKDFNDQFGRVTGFAYVPARNYRDRQTIGQIELVSLILNNRIAELESRGNYVEAVQVAIDRAALLMGNVSSGKPDTAEKSYGPIFENPFKDLMDRLFNYGASLLKVGREKDCLAWAAAASSVYPDENRWQEFILAAANNHIMRYIKSGKTADARNFLEGETTIINPANYAKLETILVDAELLDSVNKIRTAADGDAVILAIDQARSNGKIGEKRAVEILTFAVQKTSSALSAAPAKDWRAAVAYIEGVLARFGANRELEQALKTYRNNIATDFHNRFAAEWNKKNFEEAKRILNEGLSEFPDDRQLLSDKAAIIRTGNW
jgi:tetratricopeptide (TPR) repeat protein